MTAKVKVDRLEIEPAKPAKYEYVWSRTWVQAARPKSAQYEYVLRMGQEEAEAVVKILGSSSFARDGVSAYSVFTALVGALALADAVEEEG